MPVSWPVKRKNITFVGKPNPGSMKREYVVSVTVLLRDVLGYAQTAKDVKYIVNNGQIVVNGREVKDAKFACGIFDVFEIKKTNEKYVILFSAEEKNLKLVPTKDDLIYLKVAGKTITPGKKFQMNFSNGYNLLVDEKTFKSVSVQDTVVYDFANKKVVSTIALKEGVFAYIFDGNFKGHFAQIKSFVSYKGLTRDVAQITLDNAEHSTAKDYCFVVGEKKEDLKRFQ